MLFHLLPEEDVKWRSSERHLRTLYLETIEVAFISRTNVKKKIFKIILMRNARFNINKIVPLFSYVVVELVV